MEKMTPDELGHMLWANYPDYQRIINLKWLREVFRVLKIGGVWAFPLEERIFEKVDEENFVERTHDE
jgi:hypothetical protein